ncbi:MAG: GspE/PulE family protein [Janthinobacterium lividum]
MSLAIARNPAAPDAAPAAWPGAADRPVWPATIDALLLDRALLSTEALTRARLVQVETGERLEAVLTRLGLVSEAALAAALSAATGLPVVDQAALASPSVVPLAVSAAFLRDVLALPLAADEQSVTVAFGNPLDRFAAHALGFALGRAVAPVIARPSDLDVAIDRLYGATADAAAPGDALADEADLERLKDMASDAPVIRAVNRLIGAAVEARASDIHVEPADDRLVVRLRIDGVLHEQEPLPPAMRLAFVSRVKIMAGLNIAEKRLPQDGRLRLAVRGHEIDLRVATAPSIHGESVVMRILDRSSLALDFAALGFDDELAGRFRAVLHRPHGIVLVTGPTGSGKTTTLYAALADLNTADRKVLTVEDPIEYRLPGIIQTQVAPAIGLSFAAALRSFLRQDPDVMMVGEIRDIETASVAVQAALTGHTILSTLHTNSAASAVTRLTDMGVEPFLITSTLNAVLAQRLVRRLCPSCRTGYTPAAVVLAAFGSAAHDHAGRAFFRATGCTACDGSGFRGRVALTELLVMDETIAGLVLARAEAREIDRAAVAASMRTLLADGLLKAAAGLTTLDEVLRVATDG